MMIQRRSILSLAAAAAAAPLVARAQPAAAARGVRLRGTIEALSDSRMTLRQRNGEAIELVLSPRLTVTEVYPIQLADVRAGSFIGVGAMPQADGTQRAIAVTLFPESMRGTGEGHYPFDYLPQSTMTNATVADVAAAPDGERLEVRYKDGGKTIVVPPDAPVVSLRPSDRGLLVVGAHVAATVQEIDGQPTVVRVSAGRDGFVPPY